MKRPLLLLSLLVLIPLYRDLPAQRSIYELPFENSGRIPVSETKINKAEISDTYQTLGNIYTTEVTGRGEKALETVFRSFFSDPKVVDAVRFLEYYLEEQLVTTGEPEDCKVEMSIIYFNEKNRMNAGSVLGVVTFGLASLLGVPISTAVTDVEIEATFRDISDLKLTSKRGTGRGKKLLSLYNTSRRKAHQRALKNAIEDLNMNVLTDPALKEKMQGEWE